MWLPTCGTNVVYLNSYLNHSTAPNLRTRDGFTFIALRKICEGEELTADYHTYGADDFAWRTAARPPWVPSTDSVDVESSLFDGMAEIGMECRTTLLTSRAKRFVERHAEDIHELRAPISARSLIELCKSKKCPVGSSAVPSESQRAYCPRPCEISD